MIKALAEDYNLTLSKPISIAWVSNHSRNTQRALLHSYIDIALTYERDQEAISVAEGWAINRGCVFHDHFVLVGPVSDPAGIRQARTVLEALAKIAETRTQFRSRNDGSATMYKEAKLWAMLGIRPWEDASATWYISKKQGPPQALVEADMQQAYLLTDRSTLLRQTVLGTIVHARVFFEPVAADDPLMNSCYALTPSRRSANEEHVERFLKYLSSSRGQNIVALLNREVGLPLWAPVNDGLATTFLRGGRPWRRRWVFKEDPSTTL